MVPVELSSKLTPSGETPLVGVATKSASGTVAPMPMTELILLALVPAVTVTTLLKLAALVGANCTTRLVELKPDKLKGVPDKIVNGPLATVAIPLLSGAPPEFVITKLAWAFDPTRT